jgi:hypothetical protein
MRGVSCRYRSRSRAPHPGGPTRLSVFGQGTTGAKVLRLLQSVRDCRYFLSPTTTSPSMPSSLDLTNFLPATDDVYRVHWYGACTRPTVGHLSEIQIFLAPVSEFDASTLTDSAPWPTGEINELKRMALPIGLLPVMPLGTLVSRRNDGLRILPAGPLERFTIHPNRSTADAWTQPAVSLRPLRKKHGRSYLGSLPDEACAAWCAVFRASPREVKGEWQTDVFVIIPCLELVRFYYGSSSALIRSVLWGTHGSTGLSPKGWANPERTGFLDPQRTVFRVCLRANRPWADASIVARAHTESGLLDATLPALSYQTGLGGNPRTLSTSIHPKAYVPFDEKAAWEVRGKFVSASHLLTELPKGRKIFFASELVSCDGKFPFEHLIVEREGPVIKFEQQALDDSDNNGREDSKQREGTKPRRPSEPNVTPGSAAPHTARVLTSLRSDRFVQLRHQTPEFRLDEKNRRVVIVGKVDPLLPKKRTYGGTHDRGDEDGRHVEIHVRDDLQQLETARRDFQDLVERIAGVAKLVSHVLAERPIAANDDFGVVDDLEELKSPDDPAQSGFALPTTASLDQSDCPTVISWAQMNRERARRLFVAVFEVGAQTVYLVDVERRPTEHFRFLVIHSGREGVDPALIARLLVECVLCKGVWRRTQLGGVSGSRCTHHQQGPTPEARERLVERLARIISPPRVAPEGA